MITRRQIVIYHYYCHAVTFIIIIIIVFVSFVVIITMYIYIYIYLSLSLSHTNCPLEFGGIYPIFKQTQSNGLFKLFNWSRPGANWRPGRH